jgi:HPt (histidine-containing phosphotransfer) domain-containing protein
VTVPSPDSPVVRTDELLARLGHSSAALAQLLPLITQSAVNWQVELTAALAAGDAGRLRSAAHQIKGAMATFAAPAATAAALELEDLAKSGNLSAAASAVATVLEQVEQVRLCVAQLAK